jgi:hypothetical protein
MAGAGMRCYCSLGGFWGWGFSNDLGTVFCGKEKLLPIASKLLHFPDFDRRFSSRRRKSEAAADRRAGLAQIFVHLMIKQAGSFIPLHL